MNEDAMTDEALSEEQHALAGAAQAFCNRGINIACPWEGDLDDEERERFDALVAAINTYNTLLRRSPDTPVSVGEEAEPFCYVLEVPDFMGDMNNAPEQGYTDFSPVPKPGYVPLYRSRTGGREAGLEGMKDRVLARYRETHGDDMPEEEWLIFAHLFEAALLPSQQKARS